MPPVHSRPSKNRSLRLLLTGNISAMETRARSVRKRSTVFDHLGVDNTRDANGPDDLPNILSEQVAHSANTSLVEGVNQNNYSIVSLAVDRSTLGLGDTSGIDGSFADSNNDNETIDLSCVHGITDIFNGNYGSNNSPADNDVDDNGDIIVSQMDKAKARDRLSSDQNLVRDSTQEPESTGFDMEDILNQEDDMDRSSDHGEGLIEYDPISDIQVAIWEKCTELYPHEGVSEFIHMEKHTSVGNVFPRVPELHMTVWLVFRLDDHGDFRVSCNMTDFTRGNSSVHTVGWLTKGDQHRKTLRCLTGSKQHIVSGKIVSILSSVSIVNNMEDTKIYFKVDWTSDVRCSFL